MSKISALPILPLADLQVYADYLPIVDNSTGTTKKVSVASLQGYTDNANPIVDITALCTSDYTINSCNAVIRSGRLAQISAIITNGTTGIPKTVATVTSENIITIPSSLFASISYPGLCFRTASEVYPTAAYVSPAVLPIAIDGLKFRRQQPTFDTNSSWVMSYSLLASGNIKTLYIDAFVVMRYDVPSLNQ